MPATTEYVQLSNRVYFRTPLNRTPVPTGWSELQWIADRAATGFSAGVYQQGNDLVIAYTGTNENKLKDVAVVDLPAAIPLPAAQVWEAMELYLEVKRANPSANITFTGHSLGGGLASRWPCSSIVQRQLSMRRRSRLVRCRRWRSQHM